MPLMLESEKFTNSFNKFKDFQFHANCERYGAGVEEFKKGVGPIGDVEKNGNLFLYEEEIRGHVQ